MLPRKAFKARDCIVCGKLKLADGYNYSMSKFFLDNRLPICKDCLDEFIQEADGEWAVVDEVCQWANVPFSPGNWTKMWEAYPSHAMSKYIELFNSSEYEGVSWSTYYERWKKLIEADKIAELHPEFDRERLLGLEKRWGGGYSPDEYYTLDDYYNRLESEYGLSDVISQDNARKLAKVSLELDRAVAAGLDITKQVNAYDKIQKASGFTPERAHDLNSFESVSEIALFMEQNGWKQKFHNKSTNDIVDSTMQNIQGYNRRLWDSEATMADQIEERIEGYKNIQAAEDRAFNSSLEDFANSAYDTEILSGVYAEDDLDLLEDFRPEDD